MSATLDLEFRSSRAPRAARACTRCRGSKVKCRPGDDPSSCQLCQRAGLKCAFLPTRKERSIAKKQELASGNDAQNAHAITGGRRSTNSTSPWMSRRSLSFSKTSEQEDLRRLYSPDLLMKGVDVFFQHFYPDIFFSLHEPSVRSSAQSGTLKPLLATTILALTARFIPELVELHGSGTAAGDYFADPIRPILLMGADKPSLEKIHGFLFLSLHEWGSGRGATAFIYIGLAIRVGLLLRSFRKQTPLAPPFNKPVETREEFVVEETRVRTWWSMNSMECLLASGQNRTALTTYSETAEIGMPCREEAFVWGDVGGSSSLGRSHHQLAEPSEKECLILAVRHWSTINCWVSSGGVRAEAHPPWSPLSRFAELQGVLRSWRDQLPPKLQYDEAFFVTHAVNKQTGPYGFLHLVHFSSVIFLHREYLQFFPVQGPAPYRGRLPKGLEHHASSADSASAGDADADAFWAGSLADLFGAAARITEILVALERHGAAMLTPFVGFAAFGAATVNMYLAIFSWVHPALAAGARERTETDVRFLKQVVGLWPLAQQWYATVLRLYDSYKQFHMDGGAAGGPDSPAGRTVDAFHSFDRALMDYGEIKPEPDDMAAIVAAKDTDGYKHGTELRYPRLNEESDEGLQGMPQFGEEGYWDTVADEFLSSIMTFDAPITM